MDAEIEASNEVFEVVRGSLVSQMGISQARTEPTQGEIKANWTSFKRRWRPQ
jgi:hypothetical protein